MLVFLSSYEFVYEKRVKQSQRIYPQPLSVENSL